MDLLQEQLFHLSYMFFVELWMEKSHCRVQSKGTIHPVKANNAMGLLQENAGILLGESIATADQPWQIAVRIYPRPRGSSEVGFPLLVEAFALNTTQTMAPALRRLEALFAAQFEAL